MNATAVATLALSLAVAFGADRTEADELALPTPVGMNGDPSAALVVAGNGAFLHGDLATATRDYRAAIARKPDFAIATFNLGLVEMHGGDTGSGKADMDRGIKLAVKNGMSARIVARLRALRAAFAPVRVETT